MNQIKRVMIIGPNGVGKTKIAYDLAREHGGEIINLDRTYLFRKFPITTGLEDALKEQGVPRHLYELLDPGTESYPARRFCDMVFEAGSNILGAGRMVVAEGASTIYVPELLELNARAKFFQHVIGIRFPADCDIEGRYMKRVDQAFDEGLADEIRENLAEYSTSFIVQECHSAVPTVRYLRGEISLADAKREIVRRCLGYKDLQMRIFSKFAEIQWIDGTSFPECKSRVQSILGWN